MKAALFLVVLVGVSLTYASKEVDCNRVERKLSKLTCKPVPKAEMSDCYDLCTGEPLTEDCEKHSHCCINDCRCILRGGESAKERIPEEFKMKKSGKVSKSPGCPIKEPEAPKPLFGLAALFAKMGFNNVQVVKKD